MDDQETSFYKSELLHTTRFAIPTYSSVKSMNSMCIFCSRLLSKWGSASSVRFLREMRDVGIGVPLVGPSTDLLIPFPIAVLGRHCYHLSARSSWSSWWRCRSSMQMQRLGSAEADRRSNSSVCRVDRYVVPCDLKSRAKSLTRRLYTNPVLAIIVLARESSLLSYYLSAQSLPSAMPTMTDMAFRHTIGR